MFIIQGSSQILQAQLTGSVTTNQVIVTPTYINSNTTVGSSATYKADPTISTNGVTPVTVLAAPSSNTVNLIKSIKIYNADTASQTVQILLGGTIVFSRILTAGQSIVLSENTTS